MEGLIKDFIQRLTIFDWKAIASLTILGIVLIIANGVTHYIKEAISAKIRRRNEVQDLLASATEPIRRRADNLVSRLCNLLIGWADSEEIILLRKQLNEAQKFDARLSTIKPSEFTWIEVLAFRFLEFFWVVQRFRMETQKLINNHEVDEIEYYLVDKLPLAMRGKVYYSTYFTREEQEEISLFFHGMKLSSIEGPTLRDLSSALADNQEKRRVFAKIVHLVCLSSKGFTDLCEGMQNTPECKQLCALAHFTIYLLDIYERLSHSSKWEEYRVLLVKILKRVNELRDTDVYLYYRQDLKQRSYLFTYPEDILERYFWSRWLTKAHLKPFSRKREWAFSWCLKWRTRRFIYRHHRKMITKNGIRIKVDNKEFHIDFLQGLEATRSQLLAYLEGSGRRMPSRLEK